MLENFEQITDGFQPEPVSNGRQVRPDGMTEPKALIPEHLNDFAKRECRTRNMTASEYLGSLLAPAVEAEMENSMAEKLRKMKDLWGPNWQQEIKPFLDKSKQ